MNQPQRGSNKTGYLSDANRQKRLFTKRRKPKFSVSNGSFIFSIVIFIALVIFIIIMLQN